MHLKAFNKNYFQDFSFPVNTFPSEITLSVNGVALVPCKDYIAEASSGSGKGEFNAYVISNHYRHVKEDILSALAYAHKHEQAIVFDFDSVTEDDTKFFRFLKENELAKDNRPAAIILIENKKLTMDVSKKQLSYPVLTVLRSALKDSVLKVSFDVSAKLINEFGAHNVAAYIKGSQYPDSFIVFTAHYDHLGQMGREVYFPGANDNASGIAMLLNLANWYSKKENRPSCSVAFIAFAGEEPGLLGSHYFAEYPLLPLNRMKFLINMDLLGTGEEGMMVVNATEFPQQFAVLDSINNAKKYLVKIGQRGKARNSDHYWFTEKGVPSFFFYTLGGIAAYHDVYDRPETLPLTEFEDVFRLIIDFTTAINK